MAEVFTNYLKAVGVCIQFSLDISHQLFKVNYLPGKWGVIDEINNFTMILVFEGLSEGEIKVDIKKNKHQREGRQCDQDIHADNWSLFLPGRALHSLLPEQRHNCYA